MDDGSPHDDLRFHLHGLRFPGAVIAGVVWLIHTLTQNRRPPRLTAMDELDPRYARGEIDRHSYLHRREDLERA